MNGVEILEKMVVYETTHRVNEYVVDGWHVWPILRSAICMRWLPESPSRPCFATWPLLTNVRIRNHLSYAKTALTKGICTGDKFDESIDIYCDALFLTPSERRVLLNGKSFEIYSDPFVEALRKLGFRSCVWETGGGGEKQYSESIKILERLNFEALRLSLWRQSAVEPAWFGDYKAFAASIIGRDVAWTEVSSLIEFVTNRSVVFERWLRRSNARILFVVCWYDPIVMAATMAAKQCGVRTVEIQHGVQGKGHFAYSSWMKSPAHGYEVIPDVFWCWGHTSVSELVEYNPAFYANSTSVAGGNLWLNWWRKLDKANSSSDHELGGVKRILISLQLAVPQLLLDAISASSSKWVWMIRFHPGRSAKERATDKVKLLETGHVGIEFERSSKALLYDLMRECDLHVTESSSCALEALAFGVRTAIMSSSEFGEVGKFYYRQFIENKMMIAVNTASNLIKEISSSTRLDGTTKEISDIFSCSAVAEYSLDRLLNATNRGAPH